MAGWARAPAGNMGAKNVDGKQLDTAPSHVEERAQKQSWVLLNAFQE